MISMSLYILYLHESHQGIRLDQIALGMLPEVYRSNSVYLGVEFFFILIYTRYYMHC